MQDWKSKLVSSGLPLEYEVARLLVENECWVGADYGYLRSDGGVAKEFTVDMHAVATVAVRSDMFINSLHLLVECKQRRPEVVWLFVPDPNQIIKMSHEAVALRGIDCFSPWFIHDRTYADDPQMHYCYKGIEVAEGKGASYDSEIRHGLKQLQYAIPALLHSQLEDRASEDRDWNTPIFFIPLLVTNATLVVSAADLTVERTAGISDLSALGETVPYLAVSVDCGPVMKQHLRQVFADAPDLVTKGSIGDAERQRREAGADEYCLPSTVSRELASGSDLINHDAIYDTVIVCNLNALPALLRHLRKVVERVVLSLSRSPESA